MNTINHLAIIMDGNDRWASLKNLAPKDGYKAGAENAFKIIKSAIELGIKHLSLYTFSSENLLRPKDEVDNFMSLLDDYATNELVRLSELKIKIKFVGDLSSLNHEIQAKLKKAEEISSNYDVMTVYILLSYGSRAEIVYALKEITQNKLDPDDINIALISKNLYCPSMPDVDLLIRPGDRMRVSNFLLWQSAYAELYFSKKLWPDFADEDLKIAVEEFRNRKRTFGLRYVT